MNNTKNPRRPYNVPDNLWFLLKDIAKEHPLLLLFLALEMTLAVLSPMLNLYLPKIAVDLVTEEATVKQVLYSLGGIGLAMAISMSLSQMAAGGKYMLYNNMRHVYHYRMFLQHLSCDYHHIESAEGRQKYARAINSIAWGDGSGTSKLIVSALDLFIAVLSFILYSTVLSSLNIVIVLVLVLLSSVNLFAVRHAQNYERRHHSLLSKLSNQMTYVEQTAGKWECGKDIRLYGMENWLLNLREQLLQTQTFWYRKVHQRYFFADALTAFTLFLRDGLSYGYLIYAVSVKQIGLGDFALYFGAITGFSDFVGRIIHAINTLHDANLQMNDLRAFLDNTDAPDPDPAIPIPQAESLSIEFKHVTFAYDGSSKPVLKDFNLFIAPGEKIALVGVNGAGKTTLVKLLTGLYKPDEGQIRINGIDIQNFSTRDLYQLFSVVFQDLFIPPFTVAENVSMKLLKQTNLTRVEDCLKKAGLLQSIRAYPDGIHSYLQKEVHDGIVLSGGQQQKLLLARALYKDAPILILDEPTSALDPIAESETYEHFNSLSRDKTAIYISHRLASTRFCDRIILLQDGTVAETGSHEDLLAQNGLYSDMYALQSRYYTEKGEKSYE